MNSKFFEQSGFFELLRPFHYLQRISQTKRTLLSISVVLFLIPGCSPVQKEVSSSKDFSFAFLTDIHLQPRRNSVGGFEQAIDTLNKLNPEFVLTGGDLVEHGPMAQADTMFQIYKKTCEQIEAPVYNTIGNHDCFNFKKYGKDENANMEDWKKMYKKYVGDTYYSFDHNGWHFMVLDALSISKDESGNIIENISIIDSAQMAWMKSDLAKVDASTPIVLSTHIPFINSRLSWYAGFENPLLRHMAINNRYKVLKLFENYNLKLVLQGHLHNLDDINIHNKVRFISGGAVSANWWKGPLFPDYKMYAIEEGFLMLHIKGDDISWEYIDYGWDAAAYQ